MTLPTMWASPTVPPRPYTLPTASLPSLQNFVDPRRVSSLPVHLPACRRGVRQHRCRAEGPSQNGVGNGTVSGGNGVSVGQSLTSLVEKAQNSILQVRMQLEAARAEIGRLKARSELDRGRIMVCEAEIAALQHEKEVLREQVQTWQAAATAMEDTAATGLEQLPPVEANTKVDTILLFYHTGWKPAYIHYNLDDQGWTEAPGQALSPEQGDEDGPEVSSISLPGRSLHFVMTDGKGQWDKPSGEGANYAICEPGSYLLNGGQITNLKIELDGEDEDGEGGSFAPLEMGSSEMQPV